MGLGPNSRHCLIPFHGRGGCGAFQRRSPTGAAANGIPL